MFIKETNGLGGLKLEDYEPGSVFEFRAQGVFDGYWLVVDSDNNIKNFDELPDGIREGLDKTMLKNEYFFANNIFAVNLSTGESCFFNTMDLECMRKVRAVVEIS